MDTPWRDYVGAFHEQRPGVTEELLASARDQTGATPYDWAAGAVPPGAAVLDLGCGSAPTAELLTSGDYLGADLSADELRLAVARGVAVVQADATALPVRDAAVDVVVTSMALMLVPLVPTLAEVARVLRPGGLLVAVLPASGPVPVKDRLRYARLLLALGTTLDYPNDAALDRLLPGFTVVSDERRGFRRELADPQDAALLVRALYLPDVDPGSVVRAEQVAGRWVGSSITVPLRLLVARVGR